ncbi:uncharacterized protein LOC113333056 [Papaver somniferum]|uniref:uncharacterized protein LOC113333056 n=1 Tax=Papaver somniferum TaxID=3469 RepID=UPI000E6FCD6B|nr:uncharacterized protein LOC113333056 [Papaver somniferum]
MFQLLYKHGYWSDSLPSGVTTAAWCMFDKKLETADWNSRGIKNYSLSQRKVDKVSYKLIVDECLFLILDSFRRIFDRGKEGKLIKGYLLIDSDYRFCFEVFASVSFVLNVGSVSMAYDKEKFVHEILTKHGFEADSWFRVCMLANPMDILCFEHKFFFNHTVPTGIFCCHCLKFTDKVFDRRKEFEAINWISYILVVYVFFFDKTTSGMLVFSVCSILRVKFHGNSVCKPILKHGYGLNLLLMQMVGVVKHESDMLPIHSRESVVKLWSMGDGWITMWLFIKIPEAPVTIGCGRWLFDRGKIHEPILWNFHCKSFCGAEDIIFQLQLGLSAATRVLYDELLKEIVGWHECRDVSLTFLLKFKPLIMLLLPILTVVSRVVYLLRWVCPSTLHGFYQTIQAHVRQNCTNML